MVKIMEASFTKQSKPIMKQMIRHSEVSKSVVMVLEEALWRDKCGNRKVQQARVFKSDQGWWKYGYG